MLESKQDTSYDLLLHKIHSGLLLRSNIILRGMPGLWHHIRSVWGTEKSRGGMGNCRALFWRDSMLGYLGRARTIEFSEQSETRAQLSFCIRWSIDTVGGKVQAKPKTMFSQDMEEDLRDSEDFIDWIIYWWHSGKFWGWHVNPFSPLSSIEGHILCDVSNHRISSFFRQSVFILVYPKS